VRRLTVPASAVCVGFLAAACGGSAGHVRTRTLTAITVGATATQPTETTTPAPPSAAAIEHAVTLTAAKPGYAARLSARIGLPQFNGNALTAIGEGHFDPRSGSGTLDVAVQLPGLLGLAGPLPAPVRLVGSEAYVQVPSEIADQLPSSDAWLEDSIQALGLGDSLSPPDILREVARDATQTVPGQRATVTIDPATGLVHALTLSYSVRGGYHVRVHLSFTGFGVQPSTAPPPAGETGGLRSALGALGF
jgi:hypothetical protein